MKRDRNGTGFSKTLSPKRINLSPQTHLIITRKCGRLGNRLTLLSHILATALDSGGQVVDLSFDEYADLFEFTAGRPVVRLPSPVIRVPWARTLRTYLAAWGRLLREGSRTSWLLQRVSSPSWLTLPSLEDRCYIDTAGGAVAAQTIVDHCTCFVDGWWFRNATAVRAHSETIRKLLVPVDSHSIAIRRTLATARRGVDKLIGVHIRREDYRTARPHWVFMDEVYLEVMKRVSDMLPHQRCGFLIASPEKIQFSAASHSPISYASGQVVEDLYALAGCDYLVGVPSTFCQWASFYGKVPYFVLTEAAPTFSLDDFKVYDVPWGT